MAQTPTLETVQTSPVAAEDEKLYEVVDGQRKDLEPMVGLQVMLAWQLSYRLDRFVQDNKLGVVVTEMLFVLDSERDLQRRPDVAFVSYPRWPEKTVPNTAAWNVVPDLAVEVVSPINLAEEIDVKITEYFAAGARLVWILYPETDRLYVFNSPSNCTVLERSGQVEGGDVLPGFRLQIESLFEAVTKPE